MSSQSQRELDALDWQILRELQTDARLSHNELARRVGLSSPAVTKRVRRMEDNGVITGYRAEVDPAQVGLPLTALLHLRCDHEKCMLKTARAKDYPEILEVLKVSGNHCTVIKAAVASTAHLEALLDRLGRHGPAQATMVWSSAFNRRTIDWESGLPTIDRPDEWK